MTDPTQPLLDFVPQHDFFVGIDSDGCVFDTMELKHKECFIPNIVQYFDLQPVSKYTREAAEFVNLYSKWRGVNRWPAVVKVFDLLRERPEVQRRGVNITQAEALRAFIDDDGFPLSNDGLQAYMVAHPGEADLERGWAWTNAVNDAIAEMVHGVSPFPYVRDSLEAMGSHADMIVVSATPCRALEQEWNEHDLARYMAVIAGQEMGGKALCIKLAAEGKYPPERILMMGDAPGDMRAAKANHALFYPIIPGHEEESWQRFHDESMDRFFADTYAGDYEASLIAEFERYLPEIPPWQR